MELCALIAEEKDHARFQKLVVELNEILDQQKENLGKPEAQNPKPDS